jgi:hypothetical protein
MTNVNITATVIEFFSSVANGEINSQLIAPKWEVVDSQSLHIISDAGVYYFATTSTTFNQKQFDSSEDALTYLNNL